MAWYTKYRCEWTDLNKGSFKVDIEDTVDPGSIITLLADGDPFTSEHLSPSDDIHQNPIKGSIFSLKVKCSTDFTLQTLYAVQDQQFRMTVYLNTVILKQGFIITDQYSEPYDCTPYTITITATDQLGILKNIPYDNAGEYYNGRIRESKIILDILAKIGLTQFTEYINIYEIGMNDDVDDSPFDQLSIDTDVFQGMSCYEVLSEILKKYNASIINIAGEMTLFRPVELKNNTIYGRAFTGETTKTAVTSSPQQLINRTGSASDFRDVNGGTLMILPPASKIGEELDCGNKDSWIDNWRLENSTFTGSILSGWSVKGWVEYGTADPIPVSIGIPGESTGMMLNGHNTYPTLTNYMAATFGTNAVVSSNVFVIEFDYMMYNSSLIDRTGHHIYIIVKSDNASKYLKIKDEEYCEWSNTSDKIDILVDAPQGTVGWQHFSRKIVGIPTAGSYTIKLCACSNTYLDNYVGYNNIQFYTLSTLTSIVRVPIYKTRGAWWNIFVDPISYLTFNAFNEGSKVVGMRKIFKYTNNPELSILPYEKDNSIKGKEFNYGFILGDIRPADVGIDNILEQFAGSLARLSANETLQQATMRFVTINSTSFTDLNLTYSTTNLLFTAKVPGVDFTSTLVFTNVSGTVAGTVSTLIANAAGQVRIDKIQLTGSSGTANVTCNGVTRLMTFDTDLAVTIDTFNSIFCPDYPGIALTLSGADTLVFTQYVADVDFTGATSITNVSGDLAGTVTNFQSFIEAVARVDQIALSGSSGSASLTYNSSTYVFDIAVSETITPTSSWHTRGGSENKPLLHLIVDELANQMKRPRHMIAGWPIREGNKSDNTPKIDLLGRFEDALNEDPDTSDPRMFVFNRGRFEGRKREWEADYIEIL